MRYKGRFEFNQKQGSWVWKDTYIFVDDCSTMVVAAHHPTPEQLGHDVMSLKEEVKVICGGERDLGLPTVDNGTVILAAAGCREPLPHRVLADSRHFKCCGMTGNL